MNLNNTCPCGSSDTFENCCQSLHLGLKSANSPIELMRSRYTAFSTNNADYLMQTSSRELLEQLTKPDLQTTIDNCEFIKLSVLSSEENHVEFIASYITGDKLESIHERSTFVFEQGSWKYDSGQHYLTPSTKLSRNDPCPCGSGKKFKKCHMK